LHIYPLENLINPGPDPPVTVNQKGQITHESTKGQNTKKVMKISQTPDDPPQADLSEIMYD